MRPCTRVSQVFFFINVIFSIRNEATSGFYWLFCKEKEQQYLSNYLLSEHLQKQGKQNINLAFEAGYLRFTCPLDMVRLS